MQHLPEGDPDDPSRVQVDPATTAPRHEPTPSAPRSGRDEAPVPGVPLSVRAAGPGSAVAGSRGCCCSVLANAGYRTGQIATPFVDPGCALHARSGPAGGDADGRAPSWDEARGHVE